MRNLITISLISSIICAFQSCKMAPQQASALMDQAGTIAYEYPDSALVLLNSIEDPYELYASEYNRYILLSVLVKHQTQEEMTAAPPLFVPQDRSLQQAPSKYTAWADFYCGQFFQDIDKKDSALTYYRKANEVSQAMNDTYLAGLSYFRIGDIHRAQHLPQEAIENYASAETIFAKQQRRYKETALTYQNTGICFFMLHELDSAQAYFSKAISLAEQQADTLLLADLKNNLGTFYLSAGYTEAAKKALQEGLVVGEGKQQVRLYLHLAQAYLKENNPDSVKQYAQRALHLSGENHMLTSSVYLLLSHMEQNSGNLPESMDYLRRYAGCLEKVIQEHTQSGIWQILERQRLELLQGDHKRLNTDHERSMHMMLIFVILLLLIILIAEKIRVGSQKKIAEAEKKALLFKELAEMAQGENEELQEQDKNLKEREEVLLGQVKLLNEAYIFSHSALEETRKNEEQKELFIQELRKNLLIQFDIFRKQAELQLYLKENGERLGRKFMNDVNSIIYGSKGTYSSTIFTKPVELLYPGFIAWLKEEYSMDRTQIHYCCLTMLGFQNHHIAILMNESSTRTNRQKSEILKLFKNETTDVQLKKTLENLEKSRHKRD